MMSSLEKSEEASPEVLLLSSLNKLSIEIAYQLALMNEREEEKLREKKISAYGSKDPNTVPEQKYPHR